jgi:hypothetical protein
MADGVRQERRTRSLRQCRPTLPEDLNGPEMACNMAIVARILSENYRISNLLGWMVRKAPHCMSEMRWRGGQRERARGANDRRRKALSTTRQLTPCRSIASSMRQNIINENPSFSLKGLNRQNVGTKYHYGREQDLSGGY